MSFYNSNRYGQRGGEQPKEDKQEKDEDNFIGMEFRSNAYADVDLERQNRDPAIPRPYRPIRSNFWPAWKRKHDRIELASFMPTEEANDIARKRLTEEYAPIKLRNMHHLAFPDELIWIVVGTRPEYLPYSFICPNAKHLQHPSFSKEEVEAEQWRMDLVYKMIYETGIVHIEDLFRHYLRRNKLDEYPFDGFTHFYQFITDRSHVFGIDQHHMVYNHNLLVSVAVLRYAHALHHGTPVTDTPNLFKRMGGRLILRAFLAFMHIDDLSFDGFFRHFPAIFEFDKKKKVWKLREETVYSIPSAFNPRCLPRTEHNKTYVDRSQIVSGLGKVKANKFVQIKIESEDTLRSGMPYMIGRIFDGVSGWDNFLDFINYYPYYYRVTMDNDKAPHTLAFRS